MKDWHCPSDDAVLVPERELFNSFWKCPLCHKEFTWALRLSRTQGERAVQK